MPIADRLTSVPDVAPGPNPASTLVQVAALFRPELLVEVEAVVAVPGG